VSAFARRHEVEPLRVYYWIKRSKAAMAPAALVEVKLARSGAATGCQRIELELASGRRLVVTESIDVLALRRIVDALEQ
jgi:uncharacterized membrane protein